VNKSSVTSISDQPVKLNVCGFQDVFARGTPTSATAYAVINGTEYAVSTTIRYGSKPASNVTMLTVSPQSTEATTPTKTPEQMQQEAQQNGWLSISHEFSWSWPFYRLHLNMTTSPYVEFIFTPLALDLNMKIHDEQDFQSKIEDAFDLSWDLAIDMLVGKFAALAVAKVLGQSSLTALGLAIAVYAGASFLLGILANANQRDARTWLIAYLGCVLSAGGQVAYNCLKFIKWGSAIVGKFLYEVYDVWHAWWGAGIGWGLITDFLFVLVDIALLCLFPHFYNVGYVV
jgi:hypothetical protein